MYLLIIEAVGMEDVTNITSDVTENLHFYTSELFAYYTQLVVLHADTKMAH